MNIDEEEKDIRVCPVCGKEVERSNMLFTHDCHGIPFRLVCSRCWEKLMSKGYEGVKVQQHPEVDTLDIQISPEGGEAS